MNEFVALCDHAIEALDDIASHDASETRAQLRTAERCVAQLRDSLIAACRKIEHQDVALQQQLAAVNAALSLIVGSEYAVGIQRKGIEQARDALKALFS